MTQATRKIIALTLAFGTLLSACGGGGGGGDGGGNTGGGGASASTYTVDVTAIEMTDSRTGNPVNPTGLPISGATVTRN